MGGLRHSHTFPLQLEAEITSWYFPHSTSLWQLQTVCKPRALQQSPKANSIPHPLGNLKAAPLYLPAPSSLIQSHKCPDVNASFIYSLALVNAGLEDWLSSPQLHLLAPAFQIPGHNSLQEAAPVPGIKEQRPFTRSRCSSH